MDTKKFRICVTVKGVVQGVGFRWYVQRHAERIGLRGFVKNLYNGDVYAEAEGEEALLKDFISTIKRGPSGSHVTDTIVSWSDSKYEFNFFEIRH